MDKQKIRVRFAPSPTGPLHIGGVRTALYNYLFAKKHNGQLILRIEDTDRNRYVEGAEQYILDSLAWCGIHFDEDIVNGGDWGPYRQSERKEIYRQYAEQLVQGGHAYYAFDSEEDIEKMRVRLKDSHATQVQYGPLTRLSMKNSLTLTATEVKTMIDSGIQHVIRIKIPDNEDIKISDLVRGEVVVNSQFLDDKVLFKSDGWPTYHLANVVDDHLMEVSHVIRGEEWLPSAPLHVLLYRYLGWEDSMPAFAHLPLLLKPEGNGKLSKRDGDRLGFPVFPLQWTDPVTAEVSSGYRESGYLPEAFINMLAFLGWNPGTEQEIFSMEELIESFSIERVGRHGSKFDPDKAKWFNHHYLQAKSNEELSRILRKELDKRELHFPDEYINRVVVLIRERANLISDLWDQSNFFFEAPSDYDPVVVQKVWTIEINNIISSLSIEVKDLKGWDHDTFQSFIKDFVSRKGIKTGQLMNPLRLLIVGGNRGPGLIDILMTIGREEFEKRVKAGLEKLT